MYNNTTVTLSLHDFDELRDGHAAHRNLAKWLSVCFKYSCIENQQPQECETCKKNQTAEKWDADNEECYQCEVLYNNPEFTEKLTVDVARLIKVAKEYSLYGDDIETDLENLPVTEIR